jgi:hypothetical protein
LVLVPLVFVGMFVYRKRLGFGTTTATSENELQNRPISSTTSGNAPQGRTISVIAEEIVPDAAVAQQPPVPVPLNLGRQVIQNGGHVSRDQLDSLNYKDQCRSDPTAPPPPPLANAVLLSNTEGDKVRPKLEP